MTDTYPLMKKNPDGNNYTLEIKTQEEAMDYIENYPGAEIYDIPHQFRDYEVSMSSLDSRVAWMLDKIPNKILSNKFLLDAIKRGKDIYWANITILPDRFISMKLIVAYVSSSTFSQKDSSEILQEVSSKFITKRACNTYVKANPYCLQYIPKCYISADTTRQAEEAIKLIENPTPNNKL